MMFQPLLLTLVLCSSYVQAEDRLVRKFEVPDGRLIVVAEGDYEPCSIGSYSVRLYSAANPEFPFDDFRGGIVVPRDGVIEKLELEDINNDGLAEFIVIVQAVGTGSYLSVDAFMLGNNEIKLVVSVDGIETNSDILKVLKESLLK